MNKILLLFTAFCFAVSSAVAQGQVNQTTSDLIPQDQYVPGTMPAPPAGKQRGVGDPFPSTIGTKTVIGKTTYDLQTNGALQNRIMVTGGNEVHAAWTMSQETGVTSTSSFADRGTGYAYHNGTAWGAAPTARIEGATRTGFGGMAVNGSGNVVYMAHSGAYDIMLSEKASGTWNTVTTALNSSPIQAIWPDVATSGNWMYVICGSADSNSRTNGIRNGYYFSRSNDNGATWIDNVIPMPLIDSAGHYRGGGNAYSISARDSIVAIVFGDVATDLTLLQSNDYGATWTKKVIWDWPLEYYNFGSMSMTDTNSDNIPDTLYTIDGAFDVAIDKDGESHIAFSTLRVFKDGTSTGYSYFMFTSGMRYYNSIADSVAEVDNIFSLHYALCNGDSVMSAIPNYTTATGVGDANYNTIGLLTMPQVSVNETNDDIYLTYTAIADGDQTEIDIAHPYWFGVSGIDGQPYREVMVLPSNNKGASFGYPVNVSRTGHYEEAFVSVPERVSGTDLHLLYQGDIEPGTILQNEDTYDSDFENYIIHQQVTISEIFAESLSIGAPCNAFELPLSISDVVNSFNGTVNIYPNPAVDFVTVELDLDKTAKQVSYELFDLTGRLISTVTHSNISTDNVQISVQDLSAGNYILKVNADNALSTHKVSVK